ncbi:MAG TPA: diacylglycerol kinase family protein [Anaerolineae bacterium]
MAPDKKERGEAVKDLHRAQEKHAVLLEKIGKSQAKVEKQKRKLHALEAKMARLERASAVPTRKKRGDEPLNTDHLRRARLIFNPDSGDKSSDDSHRLMDIVDRLRHHGILAGVDFKTSGKVARDLAKAAVENGDDLVIVAGGDGTIEEVASELVGSETTLGIIPTGTMNNLARCLGVPLDIEQACALLGMGVTRRIDVGRVVTKGKTKSEYFLEAAGFGLSAIVIPAGQALEKGRWGSLPFAVRKYFETQPELIRIELDDDKPQSAHSQIVTVSNAPMLGDNILIAPDAKMDDGYLDIAFYDGMTKTDLLKHFIASANGQHSDDPKVKFHRGRRVHISAQQALDGVSDSDAIRMKRVELEIDIVPHALSVVVGKGIGLSIPVESAPAAPPLSGKPEEPAPKQPPSTDHGDGSEKQAKQAPEK